MSYTPMDSTNSAPTTAPPAVGLSATAGVAWQAGKEGAKLALASKANDICADVAIGVIGPFLPELLADERGKQLVRVAAPFVVHWLASNHPGMIPKGQAGNVVRAAELALTVESFRAWRYLLDTVGDKFTELAEVGAQMAGLVS